MVTVLLLSDVLTDLSQHITQLEYILFKLAMFVVFVTTLYQFVRKKIGS